MGIDCLNGSDSLTELEVDRLQHRGQFKLVRRVEAPPIDGVTAEPFLTLALALFVQEERHGPSWVSIALEPLHPEYPFACGGPVVQLRIHVVDVDEEVACRSGLYAFRLNIGIYRVSIVIETKRVLLVHEDQIAWSCMLAQPVGHARNVLPCEPSVIQISPDTGNEPYGDDCSRDQWVIAPAPISNRNRNCQQHIESGRHETAVTDIERATVDDCKVV